jgi:hypothetical protein
LNKTSKARRGAAWADLDKDSRPDLLVAEPESGQVTVHLQQADGSLGSGKTFPSLLGITDLAVTDWDGDDRPEIFLLGADERQIGVTRLEQKGTMPFPSVLPFQGRPLALAVGPLIAGEKPSLVAVIDQEGRRELQVLQAGGELRRQRLDESFRANPASVSIHDVNQDGHADLVILIPYERVKVLLQVPGKDFDEQDVVPPGGGSEQPWLTSADVDSDGKPELLLAQRNFLRAVLLKPNENRQSTNRSAWSFLVKEQINGAASNSRIIAAAGLGNGTNPSESLVLLDAERKVLTLCDRTTSGVWQVTRNLPLPVTEFRAVQGLKLGPQGAPAVAFTGLNSVAWLALGGETWQFTELDGYETPVKDGYLNDVISGDLNQDGRKDLIFMETAKSYLDVVTFEPPHELVPANRWQVFEERSFRSRRSDALEPREALVADFTGDGRNDLVVLVHDRIILYPQE